MVENAKRAMVHSDPSALSERRKDHGRFAVTVPVVLESQVLDRGHSRKNLRSERVTRLRENANAEDSESHATNVAVKDRSRSISKDLEGSVRMKEKVAESVGFHEAMIEKKSRLPNVASVANARMKAKAVGNVDFHEAMTERKNLLPNVALEASARMKEKVAASVDFHGVMTERKNRLPSVALETGARVVNAGFQKEQKGAKGHSISRVLAEKGRMMQRVGRASSCVMKALSGSANRLLSPVLTGNAKVQDTAVMKRVKSHPTD